ncbi:MAG: acyltransferase family protein [Jejuia sp.]
MSNINSNNFDFLRAIFASTVTVAHLIELSQVPSFQKLALYFNTRLAIDGFFIISGFLIAKSFENSQSLKSYILKRIKRIAPAYFFVILSCSIFFYFISSYSFFQYFFGVQFWKYLLANLTFQNYLEPCLPGVFNNNLLCSVNGALWTIKIEEAFYLLVPIFYFLIRKKYVSIYVLSIVIYLISISYFNYFMKIDNYRLAKQLPGAFSFFITGIILYKNFNFFIKWKYYIILPCLFVFIIEQYILQTQIIKPICFGFLVFYAAYSFKWLNNFGKFGDFTYGIYIYHFPLIQLFVYIGLFKQFNPAVVSILLLILVLLMSILSWYLIELHYLSKSRKSRHKNLLKHLINK